MAAVIPARAHSPSLRDAEDRLGFPLPEDDRRWLAATNGGEPELAVTLPDYDLIWEDRAYGLRADFGPPRGA